MGMKSKRFLFLALMLCLALLLCGCRARVGGGGGEHAGPDASSGPVNELRQGESTSPAAAAGREEENVQDPNGGEANGRTKENPDSSRKEYDENAPAEIVPGTDRELGGAGDGDGASETVEDAEKGADMVSDRAEETARRTIAAGEAEQMGVSEDADEADSALTYYTVLVRERMGSMYECQRLNLYCETARDHVTVHKTSPEHALILTAGCYDVSARLLQENLTVDDGWVARKNPGVIVKIVESGVLGRGVGDAGAASAVYEGLLRREGWAAVDAVRNGRVLLLSREMLEAPYLQAAAAVMIAREASPALFSDVDPGEALRLLTQEATGALPTGTYYYCRED